jgi:hypothetical protein
MMLAARAMMSALLCGTLRTFFADFLSLFNGTNSTFVLGDGFLTRLLMVSSPLWFWGSAQNPRMNPCPSARPGVATARRLRTRAVRGSARGSRLRGDVGMRQSVFGCLAGARGSAP